MNDKSIRPVSSQLPPAGVPLNGTELIQPLSAAVVLAKVPIKEQLQEYKNTLSEAKNYNPQFDYPKYKGYRVQRAEVVPGQELKWELVRVPNGLGKSISAVADKTLVWATANWAGGEMPDESDPRYLHSIATFPLPPLVGRNWDDLVRHSEVPLAADFVEEEDIVEDEEFDLPEGDDDSSLFETAPGDRMRRGRGRGDMEGGGMYGGRGRGGPRGGAFPRGEMGEGGGYGGYDGGMMEGGGGGRGRFPGAGAVEKFDPETGELMVEVPFYMFRFIDLTVEEGKRYKYRVQLVLDDVNRFQPKQYLAKEAAERVEKLSDKQDYVMTEWSEPSPTISIPKAGIIRVAEAKPPTNSASSEPAVTLIVESYGVDPDDRSKAIQGFAEDELRRGSVVNFIGQEVEKLIEQGRYIQKVKDFDIATGVTVLDIDGGDRINRELNEPAQVLFMDSTGRMYLRDELDDEQEVAVHRAVFADDPKNRGRGPGGAPGYGGGEGGFFEGEF